MWLIDARDLTLVYKSDPADVSYVTLSHTWDKEEVSFQDFQVSATKAPSSRTSTHHLSRSFPPSYPLPPSHASVPPSSSIAWKTPRYPFKTRKY